MEAGEVPPRLHVDECRVQLEVLGNKEGKCVSYIKVDEKLSSSCKCMHVSLNIEMIRKCYDH